MKIILIIALNLFTFWVIWMLVFYYFVLVLDKGSPSLWEKDVENDFVYYWAVGCIVILFLECFFIKYLKKYLIKW